MSVVPAFSGTWHLQCTTRNCWEGKRNVLASVNDAELISYMYQDLESAEIHTCSERLLQVIGQGRDGKLESWMRETEAGIEDESGEIRADIRTRWLAIKVTNSDLAPGFDIICSRQREIKDETVQEIHNLLSSEASKISDGAVASLSRVLNDNAQGSELTYWHDHRRKERDEKTGKEQGISETLVYDDSKKSNRSRCGIQ